MKTFRRALCLILAIAVITTIFSACGRKGSKDSGIEKVSVVIPHDKQARAVLDDSQNLAVGSYLVARMYLEELLQYDVEKGNQKDYDKLLANTIKAFENAEVLSDAMYGAALYTELLQKAGAEKNNKKAEILMMAPVNPDSGLLFMTAYAAKESEAMRWAKEITEIYDKAPSNKGVKTLADQLGTDCKHAYAQLKQAQAILEGGAYNDFADYANTCYKTAYGLKAAGTAAGLVVSVAVAGPATGLAAVAQTGGIVMGGVNTVLEVGAAGSVIATNGEGNEITTFCEKTEAQMAPVGQVFSLMSLGLNGHKLLTGGYKADGAKALAEGNYSSYLDGVKNDLFGATAYLGTSVYDYMDSGSIMSGTFKHTSKGLEFTLLETLKGDSSEDKENVKDVMKAAGVSEKDAEAAVNEKTPQEPPALNEVPLETAKSIIEEYPGIDPAGDFDPKAYENAVEEFYTDLVTDYIAEQEKSGKSNDGSVHIDSKNGSFDFYDGTGALFDSSTGTRILWTHDENGELYFIHPDDAEYTVDDDGNLLKDGKPMVFDGKPINVYTGTGDGAVPETETTTTAPDSSIEKFLGKWKYTGSYVTYETDISLQGDQIIIVDHTKSGAVTKVNNYKYDPSTGVLTLTEVSVSEPLAATTADYFTFTLEGDNKINTFYYHAMVALNDGNPVYDDRAGGYYTRIE